MERLLKLVMHRAITPNYHHRQNQTPLHKVDLITCQLVPSCYPFAGFCSSRHPLSVLCRSVQIRHPVSRCSQIERLTRPCIFSLSPRLLLSPISVSYSDSYRCERSGGEGYIPASAPNHQIYTLRPSSVALLVLHQHCARGWTLASVHTSFRRSWCHWQPAGVESASQLLVLKANGDGVNI